MFVLTVIVTVVLAAALTMSAYIKLTLREPYVQGYVRVGVPAEKLKYLAFVLLAGTAGLILGLFWAPLGIAAAAALTCYFLLAIGSHIRAGDGRSLPAPATLAALSVLALIMRSATV
ncbi:DoxX family protein [Phytoactinopolyspora endophytica]|uniref:DoxX family protein n=1 Tax=Phytoactinopolyspora endophytica TaxID=1642495 RepID=UPI00101CDB59|nr:DoxX family protein [Phytoactinopolyspora endophytica]